MIKLVLVVSKYLNDETTDWRNYMIYNSETSVWLLVASVFQTEVKHVAACPSAGELIFKQRGALASFCCCLTGETQTSELWVRSRTGLRRTSNMKKTQDVFSSFVKVSKSTVIWSMSSFFVKPNQNKSLVHLKMSVKSPMIPNWF